MSTTLRRLGGRAVAAVGLALLGSTTAGATEATGRGLVLLGVVLREGGGSFAIIEEAATSRVGFYRVGSRVGGAVVIAIEGDRVRLLAEDTPSVLRLGAPARRAIDPEASPPRRAASPPDPGGPTVSAAPAPRPVVERPPVYGSSVAVGGSRASRPGPAVSMGTGGADSASGAAAATGLTAAVTFTGLQHDGSRRRGTEFSAATLRDLLIAVTYSRLPDTPQQRLEIYTPDGSLYQRVGGPASTATETRLPIGGTWITAHALWGSWTVKVFVDGQAGAAGSATFVLTP